VWISAYFNTPAFFVRVVKLLNSDKQIAWNRGGAPMSVAIRLTVLVNANVKYHNYILEKEHSTVSLFLFSDL